jgi:hypothetical protein
MPSSAPSFEEDSGVLGVKKELNCVPILLRLMLQYRPQTASAMLDISGVGQTKLDRYGEQFMEIIREGLRDKAKKGFGETNSSP